MEADEDEDDEAGEEEDGGADDALVISVLMSKMMHLHLRLAFTVPMFFAFAALVIGGESDTPERLSLGSSS